MVRYYSTQRPVAPGSFPKVNGIKVDNIFNFEDREYVAEISRRAWGYIEYSDKIPESEADDYELFPIGGLKID